MSTEAMLAGFLEYVVADEAPRLFAIVQEHGRPASGQIAAWGMAFDDHVEIISTSGDMRASLEAPEHALHLFNLDSHIGARLVWPEPEAAARHPRGHSPS